MLVEESQKIVRLANGGYSTGRPVVIQVVCTCICLAMDDITPIIADRGSGRADSTEPLEPAPKYTVVPSTLSDPTE